MSPLSIFILICIAAVLFLSRFLYALEREPRLSRSHAEAGHLLPKAQERTFGAAASNARVPASRPLDAGRLVFDVSIAKLSTQGLWSPNRS